MSDLYVPETSSFYIDLVESMDDHDFELELKDLSMIPSLPPKHKETLFLILLNYYYNYDSKKYAAHSERVQDHKKISTIPYSGKPIVGKGANSKGVVIYVEKLPKPLSCILNKYLNSITE